MAIPTNSRVAMAPPHSQEATPAEPALTPLSSKERMRFYEPLVLLLAGTDQYKHNLAPKVPEPSPSRWNQSLEQLFHDFMNKLAQICDTKTKGPTVTAVVALSLPDKIQYRFASNQRSEANLAVMELFVTDVLETLRVWTEATSLLIKLRVLRKVIAFTRKRLEGYVKAVASCSEACLQETTGLDVKVVQRLQNLRVISSHANNQDLDEPTFFRTCITLMHTIWKQSRSSTCMTFRNKANATQHGQINPWAEMRHASGRLLSYFDGVETLIEARMQPEWAPLFYEFEVVTIPSSTPHPNPFVGHRIESSSAAEILGRMMTATHDKEKFENFQACFAELQRHNLDEHIRKYTDNKRLRPYVHAEILVHESLRDLPKPWRFFEDYRYIGTSKPTCRLCDYYFRAMSRKTQDWVQVRQSHRNLYLNWRFPDIYEHQPDAERAVKQRRDILNDMNVSVRQDTFHTLQTKVAERKNHDSNTSRTYKRGTLTVEDSSVVEDDLDDLESMMGGASLED